MGWNTFPVPTLTDTNKADLQRSAEEILLARESHFPSAIADLYDPENMPSNLRAAHARIREIRASEKRFYQKVRDLFALSSDYQIVTEQTQLFFAFVQNKLLFAATGQTAAELIVDRADPTSPNMALTTWKGSRVRKQDVVVAKNYLSADEIDTLERLVTIFLEQAELRVKQKNDLTLAFWQQNVDRMLAFNDQPIDSCLDEVAAASHTGCPVSSRRSLSA